MARSAQRHRLPLYRMCLMSGALMARWLASSIRILWLSITIYVVAATAAIVGFGLTFRN
jgi:hypothetical protein